MIHWKRTEMQALYDAIGILEHCIVEMQREHMLSMHKYNPPDCIHIHKMTVVLMHAVTHIRLDSVILTLNEPDFQL